MRPFSLHFERGPWIYFLESQTQVLTDYQAFAAMVCTQFNSSIRVFHADSTEEYLSCSLRQFHSDQGTLSQYSCTSSHAQNGVAERKHRNLKTSRAMLLASFVPPQFWVEPVSTGVYLVNIQPSTTLHGVSPLERLIG
jgi:hypothetical protein